MRILASNPDNLGDLVLRQPLYGALIADGHELALVVRGVAAPLARLLVPQAALLVLDVNPYDPSFSAEVPEVVQLVAEAKAFGPELFCVAPYQRTAIDELLSHSLEGCSVVAMNGALFSGHVDAGLEPHSNLRCERTVEVLRDSHETHKNEQLAAAIRGKAAPLPAPRLIIGQDDERAALAVLAEHGLTPGSFWVCCVGSSAHYAGRQWPADRWAEVLATAIMRHGRRCLFIGMPDEQPTTEHVRGLMGATVSSTIDRCAAPLPLNVLAAVMAQSAGYIGRDTGPMHLAAAVGTPVVTPFGGGHWPRFTPVAVGGSVVTLNVPCRGCDWVCPFTESHCISQVPAAAIATAIDLMMAAPSQGLTIQVLQPDAALLGQMAREAATTAHHLRRTLGVTTRALTGSSGALQLLTLATARETAALSSRLIELELSSQARETRLRGALDERAQEVAARDAERQTFVDIVADLSTAHEELEQTLAAARATSGTLAAERDGLRTAWHAERATLLDIITDVSEPHQTPPAPVTPQWHPHAIRQPPRSLKRALRSAFRRLRTARGRRLAELRALIREGMALLRRRLRLILR